MDKFTRRNAPAPLTVPEICNRASQQRMLLDDIASATKHISANPLTAADQARYIFEGLVDYMQQQELRIYQLERQLEVLANDQSE